MKCFDRIDHQKLLDKLNMTGVIRRAIKGWLKVGIMDKDNFFKSERGTPQGGVISPLLANIALHGMEEAINKRWPKPNNRPKIVRYADDLVILHRNLSVIKECQELVSHWLLDIGLQIHPQKTRIAHTLNMLDGQKAGFDFLSANFRQYRVYKRHDKSKKGFKTIIKPSLKSQNRHAHRLKVEIRTMRGVSQLALISRLNPIIRGWCNYFSPLVSKVIFRRMNNYMFKRLWNWAKRRHRNKGGFFISFKYWRHEKGTWAFGVRDGPTIIKHTDIAIRRFVKVRGTKSPFDGDWFYWAKRMGKDPRLPKRVAQLLKKQQGRCTWCGHYFQQEDIIEKDHILAKVLGGKDKRSNFQLLHGHCHDSKTALDMQVRRCS